MKSTFAVFVMLACHLFAMGASATERLNVLFIAVDDLRPELGCYGNKHIKSPNIDALAEQSVLFNRAYCQQAVCNPSRASLLTGLRPDSAKVWDLVTHFRDTVPDVVTLPQHFRKHGYHAVAYGKIFHNPLPDDRSWDEPNHWPENARVWSGDGLQRLKAYREQMRAAGKNEAAIRRMRAPATEDEDVADSVRPDGEIADQAIDAMRRLSSKDTPFFLAVGFINPHLPFNAPRRYWDLYDPAELPLAANPKLPDRAPAVAMNTMYELRDYMDFAATSPPEQGALSEAQQRRLKHGYYASVSFIDAQVGRLLAELNRLELRENTIIVLWGDHGWKLGEHRSWCKQTNYEIDTRVPLLIHTPGDDRKNLKCESIVEFVDVYPTLCDLAELPAPEHLQGSSLLPLLRNPNQDGKNLAFSQFPKRYDGRETMGYAMRTDRYRYAEWLDRDHCETVAIELYDHKHDPQENVNIGGELVQKAKIAELSAALWKAIPRPRPGDLARPSPPRPVVRFQNNRREVVEIFWLGPDGRRVSQGQVAPGKVRIIKTTLSHRFQIGEEQDEVVTVTKPDETIRIGEKSPKQFVKAAEPIRLRVLCYNIHHAEGVDRKLDVERIARVIRSVEPDLVALHEVDQKVKRTEGVDQPAELAKLTKMQVVFGANIKLQGGYYGNAVLSRFPITRHKNYLLPNIDGSEQRGVIEAEIQIPDSELSLLLRATHLDFRADDRERLASAKAINQLAAKHPDRPALLAGDLNATPNSKTLQLLGTIWERANEKAMPTVPVSQPTKQIDFILYRPRDRWKVIDVKVLDEAVASDHRALFAVLELQPSKE